MEFKYSVRPSSGLRGGGGLHECKNPTPLRVSRPPCLFHTCQLSHPGRLTRASTVCYTQKCTKLVLCGTTITLSLSCYLGLQLPFSVLLFGTNYNFHYWHYVTNQDSLEKMPLVTYPTFAQATVCHTRLIVLCSCFKRKKS